MAIAGALGDPYQILNVPPDAATTTIRSAYKKLMLQCHPDKVHDESQRAEKAAQFTKVQEAYELLSDPRRRRKYDEEVARGTGAAGAARAAGAGAGPSTATEAERATEKERERAARHERRQRRAERATRGDGPWEADGAPQDPRTESRFQEAHQKSQAAREAKFHQVHEETKRREEAKQRQQQQQTYGMRYENDGLPRSSRHESRAPRAPPPQTDARPPPPPQPHFPTPHSTAPPQQPHFPGPHTTAAPQQPHFPGPHTTAAPQQPHFSGPHTTAAPQQPHFPGPHNAPPQAPPPPSGTPPVRPGYKEAKAEEDEKLAQAKARMRAQMGLAPESPLPNVRPSPSRRDRSREKDRSREQDPEVMKARADMKRRAALAEQAKEQELAAERDRKHMEERLRKENFEKRERFRIPKEKDETKRPDKFGHSSDTSSVRETSPPRRRPSHTTTPRAEMPGTPPRSIPHLYGTSAPLSPLAGHFSGPGPRLRRRNSISESPSLEKQQQRQYEAEMRRRTRREEPEAPYDSGYSSPSPDTPIAEKTPDETVPDGPVDATGIPVGANGLNGWKRFTFDVFVQESEAGSTVHQSPAQQPRGSRRKGASQTGSPPLHAADHITDYDVPLPPNFPEMMAKATGIVGDKPYYVQQHSVPPSSVGGVPIERGVPIDRTARYASGSAAGYMHATGSYPPQPPPSSTNYTHSPTTSHASHSSHGSPHMRPSRTARATHVTNSPHSSPKFPSEQFAAPLQRSNTMAAPLGGSSHNGYHATPQRRHMPAYPPMHSDYAPPHLGRNATWN